MDVARINTSHSSIEDAKTRITAIREISKKHGRNTAIMLDLQGPKIRIGILESEIDLKDGQEIIFSVRLPGGLIPDKPINDKNSADISNKNSLEIPGESFGKNPAKSSDETSGEIPDKSSPQSVYKNSDTGTGKSTNEKSEIEIINVDYANFLEDIKDGSVIFIDDGLIECRIVKADKNLGIAHARVIRGGILKSKKGINLPGVSVSISSITQKDLDFLQLGIDMEVDFIAQSFVRDADDVKHVKEIIKEQKSHIMVIAKIEKHEAVANFDAILKRADAIMIARGDLGIEIPPEDVPGIQKDIIRKANITGKPVITATQMLDSMIRNPRPTRAEVSDVANAIYDGSDALMLSGETASGQFPLESFEMMSRIISKTEEDLDYKEIMQSKFKLKQNTITEAISFAACEIANVLNVRAIITATQSGSTARHISKNRPESTIIGASPNGWVIRQLMISWGVNPVRTKFTENIDTMIREAVEVSRKAGHVLEGQKVVITGGIMSSKTGSTDFINVWEVE